MIANLLWISLTFIALSLQSTFFLKVKPDLLLLVVCFFALRHDFVKSLCFGAFSGLLLDIETGFLKGPGMLSRALIGYMVVTIRQGIFGWGRVINTFVILLAAILDYFIFSLCFATFSHTSNTGRTLGTLAMDTFFTIAISLILFPFTKKIYLQKT